MFITRIEKPEKTVLSFCGIKFTRKHKKVFMDLYNKNRFYNAIVKNNFSIAERRGILEDRFYKKTGYFPNLNNPQTFNEKMTWLKLYCHDEVQKKCVDKITFKDYIAQILGKEYVIPTIAVYDRADDINFDELPQKFVIKSNCGWGGDQVIIVKDKTKINIDRVRRQANSWLVTWNNYFYQSFDWEYENLKPRILVEEFLEAIDGDVPDYKFHCFNGEPKAILTIEDRFKKGQIKKTFLDDKWNVLPIRRPHSTVNKNVKKPKLFDEMLKISRKLGEKFPFVRVDFYNTDNKIYVGELTFYPGGGVEPFATKEWDIQLGELLKLPDVKEK